MTKQLALKFFNYCNKTKVNSTDVSLRANIGKGVKIKRGTSVDRHSRIGAYSYMGKNCAVSVTTIGRYCSIGDSVVIGPGDHDMNGVSTSTEFQDNKLESLTKKPCVIGHDVWIGAQSIILRGVSIGDGAVVGANSVVTRDVAAFAVVVGSPARIIKTRFDANRAQQIIDSGWWLNDRDDAAKTIAELG